MNISKRNERRRFGFYLKSEKVWWRMSRKVLLNLTRNITSIDQFTDSIPHSHRLSLKYLTERRKLSRHSKRKAKRKWNRSLHRRRQLRSESSRTCRSWRKSSLKLRNEKSSYERSIKRSKKNRLNDMKNFNEN